MRPKSVWPAWVSPRAKAASIAMKAKLRSFEARHGAVMTSEYAQLIDSLNRKELDEHVEACGLPEGKN